MVIARSELNKGITCVAQQRCRTLESIGKTIGLYEYHQYVKAATSFIKLTQKPKAILPRMQADLKSSRKPQSSPLYLRFQTSLAILLAPSKISSTQSLRPRLLLFLRPKPVQTRIFPLRSVYSLLACSVTHSTKDTSAGESAADTFSDTTLNGVDVLVACYIGGEFIC